MCFTDTATHDVTYQSVMKLITANDEPGTLEDLPPIPTTFIYGRSAERTKKETKQIQFKQLTSSHQRLSIIIISHVGISPRKSVFRGL